MDDVQQLIALLDQSALYLPDKVPTEWKLLRNAAQSAVQMKVTRESETQRIEALIAHAELSLDHADYLAAKSDYDRLSAELFAGTFPTVQEYLRLTTALRSDLAVYETISALERSHVSGLTKTLELITRESEIERNCQDKPLSLALLRTDKAEDVESLRKKLAEIQPVSVNEDEAVLPPGLNTTTPTNASEKFVLIEVRIASIDSRLERNKEIPGVVARPELVSTLRTELGESAMTFLNARASEIAQTQPVRMKLVSLAEEAQMQVKRNEEIAAVQQAKAAQEAAVKAALAERKELREQTCKPTYRTLCMNGFTTGMTESEASENASDLGYKLKSCNKADSVATTQRRDCEYSNRNGWSLELEFGRSNTLLSAVEATPSRQLFSRYYKLLVMESGLPTRTAHEGLADDTRTWQLHPNDQHADIVIIAGCSPRDGALDCRSILADGIAVKDEIDLEVHEWRAKQLETY
jgi:hypothetical protein